MKNKIRFKLSILFVFGVCNVWMCNQIYSNSQIRFINEDRVVVVHDEYLEIWDPKEKKRLDCFELPYPSYCDVYTSSDYLYLINSTLFNIVWRVDIDKKEYELELKEYSFEKASSHEERFSENIKLYSSNNGKYRIGLRFWENEDRETFCEVAYNNVKSYDPDYFKKN